VPAAGPRERAEQVESVLCGFSTVLGYVASRRATCAVGAITSEAALQDYLYVYMLGAFGRVKYEDPSPKAAQQHAQVDFHLPGSDMAVEAKYVRDRYHGSTIENELYEDIEKCHGRADCDGIIFYVYDPDHHIADEASLRAQIHKDRKYDGKEFVARLVVVH
jgi:hypothetical protein